MTKRTQLNVRVPQSLAVKIRMEAARLNVSLDSLSTAILSTFCNLQTSERDAIAAQARKRSTRTEAA